MSNAYHLQRIQEVQKFLKKNRCAALIIDYPIDLYYLTGLELSRGRLFITPKNSILFVDGRYIEACKKESPVEVKLTHTYDKDSEFGKIAIEKHDVAFDSSHTSFLAYEELSSLFPKLKPIKSPLRHLRAIKDKKEINLLKQAAILNCAGYNFLESIACQGVSEKELATQLEIFWKKQGADRLAFDPIIAFGAHTSLPHHHVSKRRLKQNDIALFDIGVVSQHYNSDMSRVRFFGTVKTELKKIYQIVLEAQEKALTMCKPGTRIGAIDEAARSWITECGYGNFFPHSLGHGVGLEIHEFPVIRSTHEDAELILEEGMVITIEPGIYIPKKGGVRIEDTIVITKHGYTFLTQ